MTRIADEARALIRDVVAEHFRQDWSRDELVEVAKAAGRAIGARVTTREAQRIVRQAVPDVVI